MSKEMWKVIENKAEKIRIAEAKGEREKNRTEERRK